MDYPVDTEVLKKAYPATCEVCGDEPYSEETKASLCPGCMRIAFNSCCIDVGGLCVECRTDD